MLFSCFFSSLVELASMRVSILLMSIYSSLRKSVASVNSSSSLSPFTIYSIEGRSISIGVISEVFLDFYIFLAYL